MFRSQISCQQCDGIEANWYILGLYRYGYFNWPIKAISPIGDYMAPEIVAFPLSPPIGNYYKERDHISRYVDYTFVIEPHGENDLSGRLTNRLNRLEIY